LVTKKKQRKDTGGVISYNPYETNKNLVTLIETCEDVISAVNALLFESPTLTTVAGNTATTATNTGTTATNVAALSPPLASIVTNTTKLTSNSCTVTGTNVLLASVVICQANPNRKGFIIFNNSANSTYVTFGATSSSATCTYLIATFASLTVNSGCIYTGVMSAIRNSGSGVVTVYELV
jgi:hypothetical protein